jgi:transcriptional regulator with XRE-family HTH domain
MFTTRGMQGTQEYASAMEAIGEGLGRRLRALRRARGMTLAEVAEETSFTAGYLSQIENGVAVPGLSALADIAAALGADIAAFFPPDEAPRVRVSRAGDTRRIRIASDPTTEYVVLASRGSDGAFSALIARYMHGAAVVTSRHFGERFVYVRSGEGVLEIAGEEHELRPGRFVHYSSHQAHSLTTTSEEPLETVWLVDPPII